MISKASVAKSRIGVEEKNFHLVLMPHYTSIFICLVYHMSFFGICIASSLHKLHGHVGNLENKELRNISSNNADSIYRVHTVKRDDNMTSTQYNLLPSNHR